MNPRATLRRFGAKLTEPQKHRVYAMGTTGGGTTLAGTTSVYISLLEALDAPDSEVVSNGTTVADCEEGARITNIDLNLIMKGDANKTHEIMLFKDENGNLATITPSAHLFAGDRSGNVIMARKAIIGYTPVYMSSSSDSRVRHVNVSPAALRRNNRMKEDDLLKLLITNNGSGTMIWWLWGTITTVN